MRDKLQPIRPNADDWNDATKNLSRAKNTGVRILNDTVYVREVAYRLA